MVSCLRFILIGPLLHGTLQLWGDPEEGGALLRLEGRRELVKSSKLGHSFQLPALPLLSLKGHGTSTLSQGSPTGREKVGPSGREVCARVCVRACAHVRV